MTIQPRFFLLIAALVLAGSGAKLHASRRILEHDARLVKPVWGTIAGIGTFSPNDESLDSGPQLTVGLRLVRPDIDDKTWHSVAYEATANSFNTSAFEMTTFDGGLTFYWPRGDVFSFDYHWFAGAGIGLTQISRATQPREDVGIAFVTGGLQGRIRDFLVEAKVKYSGGSSANALSPANGSTILLSGTYYFLP